MYPTKNVKEFDGYVQLFSIRNYLDRAAEEINEALQDAGQLSVTELSKTFNLPSEFLLSVSFRKFSPYFYCSIDEIAVSGKKRSKL